MATLTFEQDSELKFRVARLRYWSTIATLALLLGVTFGWLAAQQTHSTLFVLAVMTPLVVIAAATVAAVRSLAVIRSARLGRISLTEHGIHAETQDPESKGGAVPWEAVGRLVTVTDWQQRRSGAATVAVLPHGGESWVRSGLRGDFGNALLVVSWLRRADAARLESLVEKGSNPPGPQPS